MALIDDSDLTQNDVYLSRCKMALVSTAIAIQAEAANTANHAARSAFSLKLLADPVGFARMMAPGMTVDGSTAANSTDQNLKDRASAIFNAYAVSS